MNKLQSMTSGQECLIGLIDPQGRKSKRCIIVNICPTLRAQIHGNPPCAVYEVREQVGEHCKNQAGNEKKVLLNVLWGGLWICPIQTVKPDEAESRTAEEFAPQLQLKQLGFA